MSELVRDNLVLDEAAQAIQETPPLTATEESAGFFQRLRESASFSQAVSTLGALSLVAPVEISSIRPSESPSSVRMAEPKEFMVLADEVKQTDPAAAHEEVARIKETGATTMIITAQWITNMDMASPKDKLGMKNAVDAANELGLKVIIKAYPCSRIDKGCENNKSPVTPKQRGLFNNWLANLAGSFPTVHDFIILNEINSGSFWPQRYATGAYAAAETAFKLQASAYDTLKKAARERKDGEDITVYGLALASKGTMPPLKFLPKYRQAYLRSIKEGRRRPIMDDFAFHPYGSGSDQMPDQEYSDGRIGLADAPKLIKAYKKTFANTPQAKVKFRMIYDEYGIQTRIPPSKEHFYTGKEPSTTHPVTSDQQAKNLKEFLRISACQDEVKGVANFQDKDEPDKGGWQSGLYYTDGTAKSSLEKIQPTVAAFEAGSIACKNS